MKISVLAIAAFIVAIIFLPRILFPYTPWEDVREIDRRDFSLYFQVLTKSAGEYKLEQVDTARKKEKLGEVTLKLTSSHDYTEIDTGHTHLRYRCENFSDGSQIIELLLPGFEQYRYRVSGMDVFPLERRMFNEYTFFSSLILASAVAIAVSWSVRRLRRKSE
jgi:hypothetical protein